MNIWFFESWVCNLNEFSFLSQFFQTVSTTVTHSASDSAGISLQNEFQWTSKRDITFNSFSTEGLWVEISSGFVHLRNVSSKSSHSSIHFNESSILVESNTRAFFTSSNESSDHDWVGSHCQSFTHVTWVFVSSIRAERNIVVATNWSSIHQGRKLRNSTSSDNSGNTNASISDSTSDTISTISDKIFGTFSGSNWTRYNIKSWEFLFKLFSCCHGQFGMSVSNINNQNITTCLFEQLGSFNVILVGSNGSTNKQSTWAVLISELHWLKDGQIFQRD